MGQTLTLTASDGCALAAYLAEPMGTPKGGLVVVQEIFGVNSHIRSVAERWASEGYLVLAPALFDRQEPQIELGYAEADMQRGFGLMQAAGLEAPLLDIDAARAELQRRLGASGKVGILGFCWGGLLSWLSACKVSGISAAVPYYGGGIPSHAGLQAQCPVLAHFGERDHWIPTDSVQAFAAAQPSVQVQVYAADHGFNCDQRGSYDAAAAQLAAERSRAFLSQHLA
ncbi:MAG: dienelactone hydrolase family protein [Betaproteobacteria bacterium]|nr:dienelactone hydrolase family protein [Betaproteobacteria bacterium]